MNLMLINVSRPTSRRQKNQVERNAKTSDLIPWSIQEIRRIAQRLARKRIQPADVVVWSLWRREPFSELTDADYELGLRSKLMGQVSVARIAKDHLRERGSIVLTTGVLAMHPMAGSAPISLVNAGLEGFVRAAALEMPRGLRINAVSPPWVKETLIKFGMDPTPGQAAADVAKAYVAAVEGKHQGQVLDPRLAHA
jgi:NAD(P)-dependent dehydrogenase (short-subunit alcohol dehydrogenase family)